MHVLYPLTRTSGPEAARSKRVADGALVGADGAGDVAGRVERRVVPRAPAGRQDRLLRGAARHLAQFLRSELADRLGAQLEVVELVHGFSSPLDGSGGLNVARGRDLRFDRPWPSGEPL